MTWDIPDKGVGDSDIQSVIFGEYLRVVSAALEGTECVLSGCAVTGGADMTPEVAAGVVMTQGAYFAVSAGTATITTADSTHPRLDLVVITNAGAIAVRAGTPAAAPKPPAKTAGDVVLAVVYVPANDTTIATSQIKDLRMLNFARNAWCARMAAYPFYETDFLGAATADTGEASYAIWDYAVVASGTQSKIASTANHPGILRTTSSTTTNSGGYCRTDASAFILAGGEFTEFWFRIIDLTTLTFRLGFIDTASSTDCTDGAYIEVPSTGAAVGKTANNSTRTTSATIATLSINTWYRARIEVDATAANVTFTIFSEAGVSLGSQTNSANIPTAAGRETGHGYIATKSGTTAQACVEMDRMCLGFNRALRR